MSEHPTTPGGTPPPEGDGPVLPPPAEGPSPIAPCAECGAPLTADQTYCLECGTPTPRAPRMHSRGRVGAALVVAALVVGAGAAAAAYAVMADDDDRVATNATTAVVATVIDPTGTALPPVLTVPTDVGTGPLPPDTSGVPVVPPVDTTPTITGDFPVVTEQPGGTTPVVPPPVDPVEPIDPVDPVDPVEPIDPVDPVEPIDPVDPVDPIGGASDWPVGTSAWTAVVSSVRDETEAQGTADGLAATGEEAGVLFSSDHVGLRPGYYVVFSGSFSSREQAAAHARSLSGRYPGSYPAYVRD